MKSWLPTISISVAAFIFVTSEFLPVGLLTDIARDLGRTNSETGLVMTIYAWLVALLSIPLTAVTSKYDRRPLMLTLLVVFVAAHALTAVATSFETLVLARLFVAVAHAVFWAISIPLGIRVAPPGQRERAMSIVATGAVLGAVLGIPLGTFLGQLFGWRMGFGAVGMFAAVAGLVLYRTLPPAPSFGAVDLGVVADLFRRRRLVLTYLLTALMMTGQYSAFTFISPYLQQIGLMKPEFIATALFVYGGAGLLGSFISPRFLRNHFTSSALITLPIVALCLFALKWAVATQATTLLLVFIWGLTFFFYNLVLQNLVLTLAPDAEDVAMAGFSGIYNLGIGGGALLGSLFAVNHLHYIGFEGGALVLCAWALSAYILRGLKRAS